jgi:membrane protein
MTDTVRGHTHQKRRTMPGSDRVFLALLAVVGAVAASRRPPPARRPVERSREDPSGDPRLQGREPPGTGAGRAAAEGDSRGRYAEAPQHIPAAGWKDILLRVWKEASKDRLVSVAAGVTFYALLAIFPAIAALVSLYGLFADPASISTHLQSMQGVLPGGALEVVGDQVTRISSQPRESLGFSFALGLAISLWSANAGMKAVFDALNVVYDEEEKRSFIKLNAVSLLFTVGAILLLIAAAIAVVVVPIVLNFVGLGPAAEILIRLARWPILLVAIAVALAVLYRYGPSRDTPKWRWITWGSGFASVAWIVASALFSWYAASFGSYNATYGSLGAVIGFMTWIWISAIVMLLGAELNAETEHQTAADSTTGPTQPLGARGANMADTVGRSQG